MVRLSMTETLPKTASVVNFPIQEILESEERMNLSDWELVEQFRIQFAKFGNLVALGQVTCEEQKERAREHIRNANNAIAPYGYKPFPINF